MIAEGPLEYDDTWRQRALDAGGEVGAALEIARELSPLADALGTRSARYLGVLASLGRGDLTVARVVEPHLDALGILGQAGEVALGDVAADEGSTWGVFAAHGPGHHLEATKGEDGWILRGTKPWCSLADRLDHAVITAHVSETERAAFAIDLRAPGVEPLDEPWFSHGLAAVRSTGLRLSDVPAVPVGGPGWYLDRAGFAWGGIAVAAVWVGATRALVDTLLAAAGRRNPDQIALVHVGAADVRIHAAELALAAAATEIDAGLALGPRGALLAARVRAIAAACAEEVLAVTGRALGPAPLTSDEVHARRVADLTVYVRQHHAERDLARLGEQLVGQVRG